MKPVTTTCWGWLNAGGQAQDQTFPSPDAAIAEMQARLGKDYDIQRIHELGFRLALMEVTVKPVLAMACFDELHPPVAK